MADDLEAENTRLAKLVEPKEWLGWGQVESIYDEARLLRKERNEARARVEQLETALRDEDIITALFNAHMRGDVAAILKRVLNVPTEKEN